MAAVLFENRFILTKKLHKQYCSECYKVSRKSTQRLAIILALVSLIAGILVYFFLEWQWLVILCAVFFAYFVFFYFWGYAFSEWFNFRDLHRQHGKAIVMILDFMPSQVSVKVNKTSFCFKYSSISKAYETDDIIILILERKGMIEHGQIVYKNGFNVGQLQDFKEFINKKCEKEIFSL